MEKKYLIVLFLLLSTVSGFTQSVNDYKYVLVPSQFKFQKEPNQYSLNSITKGLLEKYGFVAYLDSEQMPNDVLAYNCNKLFLDVVEDNNFTTTRLTIVLKDCKNNILFTSAQGKSREKDWRVGYNLALREAFKSFDGLRYKYNGSLITVEREVVKTTNDGTTVKREIAIPSNPQVIIDGKETLFAQPSANGYQLVDSTPKVVLRLLNTSSKEIFIAEKAEKKGTVFNNNGTWTFEYYENGQLISETLNIKF